MKKKEEEGWELIGPYRREFQIWLAQAPKVMVRYIRQPYNIIEDLHILCQLSHGEGDLSSLQNLLQSEILHPNRRIEGIIKRYKNVLKDIRQGQVRLIDAWLKNHRPDEVAYFFISEGKGVISTSQPSKGRNTNIAPQPPAQYSSPSSDQESVQTAIVNKMEGTSISYYDIISQAEGYIRKFDPKDKRMHQNFEQLVEPHVILKFIPIPKSQLGQVLLKNGLFLISIIKLITYFAPFPQFTKYVYEAVWDKYGGHLQTNHQLFKIEHEKAKKQSLAAIERQSQHKQCKLQAKEKDLPIKRKCITKAFQYSIHGQEIGQDQPQRPKNQDVDLISQPKRGVRHRKIGISAQANIFANIQRKAQQTDLCKRFPAIHQENSIRRISSTQKPEGKEELKEKSPQQPKKPHKMDASALSRSDPSSQQQEKERYVRINKKMPNKTKKETEQGNCILASFAQQVKGNTEDDAQKMQKNSLNLQKRLKKNRSLESSKQEPETTNDRRKSSQKSQ